MVNVCQIVWCVPGQHRYTILKLSGYFQVLLRGGSTYRDMLKGEEARREDLDIDIEVKFNKICNVPFAAGVT